MTPMCNNDKLLLFALRTIADNILKSMLLMFPRSMEKEGLRLKDFCVLHIWMDSHPKKNRNFKVTKNDVVVEISIHLQYNHSHKYFKGNKHPGA